MGDGQYHDHIHTWLELTGRELNLRGGGFLWQLVSDGSRRSWSGNRMHWKYCLMSGVMFYPLDDAAFVSLGNPTAGKSCMAWSAGQSGFSFGLINLSLLRLSAQSGPGVEQTFKYSYRGGFLMYSGIVCLSFHGRVGFSVIVYCVIVDYWYPQYSLIGAYCLQCACAHPTMDRIFQLLIQNIIETSQTNLL